MPETFRKPGESVGARRPRRRRRRTRQDRAPAKGPNQQVGNLARPRADRVRVPADGSRPGAGQGRVCSLKPEGEALFMDRSATGLDRGGLTFLACRVKDSVKFRKVFGN
ncbi:hypothetical protein GCM10009716_18250 [Streptomyces sodiiphilus]|uniref:Uncharacterized protein n=1 Tax=Streptomyces sodiiphilus TaxID=226217 RepID=A0ABN2P0F8_9ACTN